MAGQIIKRGEGTWLVRIPLGRDANGKRKYHNRTVKGTKKEAQQYLTKALRDLDTGMFVEPTRQTLADFLEQWLETCVRQRVQERTFDDYKALARRHLVPALGHRRLSALTPDEIQTHYNNLGEGGLSARSVRYVHSVLHGALEQATKWGLVARNVAKLVELPRLGRREMHALNVAEATRFLDVIAGDRFFALWMLLLVSGLRPGEALALKWGDLDGNRLSVQRALVRPAKKPWRLLEPKTARARRVVTLPAFAVAILRQLREQQARVRAEAGDAWTDRDLLFTTNAGEPLDYRVIVRRHLKPLLKAAGVAHLRPYDLRHSCATLLLADGENVKVVSERLGHGSVALTLDTYAHVLPHMQQRAAERLDDMLAPPSADDQPAT